MKKLLSALFVLFTTVAYASHFSGGELRYEFNGTNYTIELALYHACDPNSISLPTSGVVNIQSVSAGVNINRTLPVISLDTFGANCLGVNSCTVPGSPYPGYVVGRYRDTITLPAMAGDWVFSYTGSVRIISTMNISAGSGLDMYLEATLDNTIVQNSNAWVPNAPGYFVAVNQVNTIPLQTVDAEGDSIVYEPIAPMQSATMAVSYFPPYTSTNPLGTAGIYSFNTTANTMSIKTVVTGKFALAFRVKEYRNGALIGSYIRDFTAFSLPLAGSITPPQPTSLTPFTVYTCPGQPHSITVNFTDATPTDSVVSTISFPSLGGYGFTGTTVDGVGSGSATMSWTTPMSMNPATMPFFYIKLRVRDDACPHATADYAVVVRTKQCGPDSVWPGDANGDYTVNIYDPLAIAVTMGETGPARVSPTTSWTAQYCSAWSSNFIFNNVNKKHADCDGNGTVTTADLAAITANYGLTHPKQGGDEKQTSGPALHFDFTGIKLEPGTTVNIPVILGDAANAIDHFYGLATRITANVGGVTIPINVVTNSSWLGNSSNTLNFTHNTSSNTVDWAHARTDHQNQQGYGQIGTLVFNVPASAVRGSYIDFTFTNTKLINKDGTEITGFTTGDASERVPFPESVHDLPKGVSLLEVVPNPSHNTAALQLSLDRATGVQVKVTDVLGKTVWQQTASLQAGDQDIILPAAQLPAGMYTIQVQAGGWGSIPVVKWVKQ